MSAVVSARTKAQRQARRALHAAQLARPGTFEALSVNDDFTDKVTDIPFLARTRHPLAIGGQETKGIDYREKLDHTWGVRQRMSNEATQGVMVAWSRELAYAVGSEVNMPTRLGHGWLPLVEPGPGNDVLTRGVIWQDVQIRGYGHKVRIASTHRPPFRDRDLWKAYDAALEAWLDASPIPVLLLTDANEAGGPDFDDEQWGWRGIGIDGAVSNLRLVSAYELSFLRSDHRPLSIAVRPGAPHRGPRVTA